APACWRSKRDSQYGHCGLPTIHASRAPAGMPRGGPLFPDRPRRGLTACRFDAFRRAAAHVPPTATPPPRSRAWLRIFVVRCGLPCDPPLGGHSCNGGMIPRFDRAVCDLYGAIGVKARVLYHLFVRPDGDHLLVPT